MNRIKRLGPLAAVVLLVMVALALPANSATVSLSPSSGQPGQTITASGSGFGPSGAGACRILFDDDSNLTPLQQGGDPTPAFEVGTCAVDGSGQASGSFVVPDRSTGSYWVAICNYCSGEFPEVATTSFEITPPPTTTTTTTIAPSTTTTIPGTTTSTTPTPTSSTPTTTTTTLAPPVVDGIFAGPLPTPLGPTTLLDLGKSAWLGLDLSFAPRCDAPVDAEVVDFDDQMLGPVDRTWLE